MRNKKGIEPVIATVLLIVITIVVVALVIAFVVPFIQRQMKGAEICYDARIEIKEACYDIKDNITIRIGRGSQEFELVGIIVSASTESSTKTLTLKEDTEYGEGLPSILGEVLYTIPIENFGYETLTEGMVTSVAVAPIVKSGITEKTCDITSQITLDACSI